MPHSVAQKHQIFGPTAAIPWKMDERKLSGVCITCVCGLNTNHANTYQKGIMFVCFPAFLHFDSFSLFIQLASVHLVRSHIRSMASNPSDRFKSKPNDLYAKFTNSKIEKWLAIKTKQKGSEMNGKLLLQNTQSAEYTHTCTETLCEQNENGNE